MMGVSARLICNRTAWKTRAAEVVPLVQVFREAAGAARAVA